MARITTHTVKNAPAPAGPLLAEMAQFSPTGRLLDLHAQMAHAPAALEAHVPIRPAAAQHGTLDPPVRATLMLARPAAGASPYALPIISMLAPRSRWLQDQVQALLAGHHAAVGNRTMIFRDPAGSLVNVFSSPSQRGPG